MNILLKYHCTIRHKILCTSLLSDILYTVTVIIPYNDRTFADQAANCLGAGGLIITILWKMIDGLTVLIGWQILI